MHSIPTVKASGRFVKIVVQMETTMFFSDEITVVGTTTEGGGETALPVSIKTDFSYNTIKVIEERLELIESITETNRVLSVKKDAFTLEQREGWLNDMGGMAQFFTEARVPLISKHMLEEAHEKLGRIRAEIYRAIYREPFVVVQADPMQVLYQRGMIIGPRSLDNRLSWFSSIRPFFKAWISRRPDVTVSLWQREYESLAFNIINCSPETLTLNVGTFLSKKERCHIPAEKIFTLAPGLVCIRT